MEQARGELAIEHAGLIRVNRVRRGGELLFENGCATAWMPGEDDDSPLREWRSLLRPATIIGGARLLNYLLLARPDSHCRFGKRSGGAGQQSLCLGHCGKGARKVIEPIADRSQFVEQPPTIWVYTGVEGGFEPAKCVGESTLAPLHVSNQPHGARMIGRQVQCC